MTADPLDVPLGMAVAKPASKGLKESLGTMAGGREMPWQGWGCRWGPYLLPAGEVDLVGGIEGHDVVLLRRVPARKGAIIPHEQQVAEGGSPG